MPENLALSYASGLESFHAPYRSDLTLGWKRKAAAILGGLRPLSGIRETVSETWGREALARPP